MSLALAAVPPLDAAPDPEAGTALPRLVTSVPGPRGKDLVDLLAAHECPAITARRARRADSTGVEQDPIVWERARGANVWDPDGNRFVDLTAGFGVASAGHGNPFVVARVTEQLGRHVHGMGDAFPGRARIELAAALADHLPGGLSQVIFGSDGSDAVEAALKTAVMATGRSRVVACEGSYHGMSLGALAVSHYKEGFRAPFAGRLGPLADWVPFGGDLGAIAATLDDGEPVAAVLVEPVQGRGGDRTTDPAWFAGLSELCAARGALLIFDEIFTGFGRAGAFVQAGTEHVAGVVPDLICLGKGMTSGFPVSACLGTPEVMGAWGVSSGEAIHTSTFLGHPVGCAAGLAVLELFDQHDLLARACALGDLMAETLGALAGTRGFGDVRGRGAMRALEVDAGVTRGLAICRGLLERGWIVLPAGTQGEALSFTPPLTMTETQWRGAMDALRTEAEST